MKKAFLFTLVATIVGCTGTTYHKNGCSEDYFIHPKVSIPGFIGACEKVEKAEKSKHKSKNRVRVIQLTEESAS